MSRTLSGELRRQTGLNQPILQPTIEPLGQFRPQPLFYRFNSQSAIFFQSNAHYGLIRTTSPEIDGIGRVGWCGRADIRNGYGKILFANLRSLQQDVAIIGEVRGRGAMVAMEFVNPGTKEPNAAAAKAIVNYCNQQGVLAISCGTFGNVVRLLPPLIISDEQLADGLGVLAAAVRSAS